MTSPDNHAAPWQTAEVQPGMTSIKKIDSSPITLTGVEWKRYIATEWGRNYSVGDFLVEIQKEPGLPFEPWPNAFSNHDVNCLNPTFPVRVVSGAVRYNPSDGKRYTWPLAWDVRRWIEEQV